MSKKLTVVIDDDIPFIKGLLEPYATIFYYKGNQIGFREIKEADAMIIRTRTKCNSSILKGSNIKFIASATIGTDHVDLEYCRKNGIAFTNAAGCNAWAVVQYVLTAIFTIAQIKGVKLANQTIGIIGAGNVGERLANTCEMLGFKVLRCDPPLKKLFEKNQIPDNNGRFSIDRSMLKSEHFLSMEDVIQKADIITLHIPLNHSTKAIFNKNVFSKIRTGTIFINSSRGEVIEDTALTEARKKLSAIVLDVWNNEPNINLKLLNLTDIATPHIAGYSLEGKINATVMIINKFAEFFGIKELSDFKIDYPEPLLVNSIFDPEKTYQENICLFLNKHFPIIEEDKKLRDKPQAFEEIRSDYLYRREISQDIYKQISLNNPKTL